MKYFFVLQNQTKQTDRRKAISSVEEKIHLEKQLPFAPNAKKGPTVDLYFHELTSQKGPSQKALRLLGFVVLGLIFILTLPLVALFIKLFSREPIFAKVTVPGRRGILFEQYLYTTSATNSNTPFRLGRFLKKTGLYKLPSVINIGRGEMNLIGPHPYPAEWCNRWNNQFSDFYKRFALPPGFFNVSSRVSNPEEPKQITDSLQQELRYILNPSLKKDLHHLFRLHQ